MEDQGKTDPAASLSGPRFQLILPVVCKAAPQEGRHPQVWSGWTLNLSETGACVEVPEALPPGMWLRLTLPFDGEDLPVSARVGWVAHPGSPGGWIVHGLIFFRLTARQRKRVQALLERQRSPRAGAERIPATLPAECRVPGAPGPSLRGWTGDLSRDGCSLLLPDQLPAGTRIMVTLTGPHATHSAGATVVWSAPLTREPSQLHPHGVRFLEANPIWGDVRGQRVALPASAAGRLAAAPA